MTKKRIILFTCEHAVNDIPQAYQKFFAQEQSLLNSHRGIDFGAITIAQHLSAALNAQLFQATASRLLIDCNRSINHPACYSEITTPLPELTKQAISSKYYSPYRASVEQWIKTHIAEQKQVLHLSIHSFTPKMHGEVREVDIGLLYDPKRLPEKHFAQQWKNNLKKCSPPLRIRLNAPYQGTSDGFTTALRKIFPQNSYLGIEVESNQALVDNRSGCNQIAERLLISLGQTVTC